MRRLLGIAAVLTAMAASPAAAHGHHAAHGRLYILRGPCYGRALVPYGAEIVLVPQPAALIVREKEIVVYPLRQQTEAWDAAPRIDPPRDWSGR